MPAERCAGYGAAASSRAGSILPALPGTRAQTRDELIPSAKGGQSAALSTELPDRDANDWAGAQGKTSHQIAPSRVATRSTHWHRGTAFHVQSAQ